MSRTPSRTRVYTSCFPRVSGDEPMLPSWKGPEDLFSPRERG